MEVQRIGIKTLNELLVLVQKTESQGNVRGALELIESHAASLDTASRNAATQVAEYLKARLPQTVQEASARAQVELSSSINRIKKIFQRTDDCSLFNATTAVPKNRADDTILMINLENNPDVFMCPEGIKSLAEQIFIRDFDGLTYAALDKRFMFAAKRLVDLNVIDDSSFVILHTGHNIPIAEQLLQHRSLGQVSGVFDMSKSCFPAVSPKAQRIIEQIVSGNVAETGLAPDEIAYIQRELTPFMEHLTASTPNRTYLQQYNANIEQCAERWVNQNFTFPNALKTETTVKGAKFIGIDFHRAANYDISKLPTSEDIRAAGFNKVVFLDEIIPIHAFSEKEAECLFEPLREKTFYEALNACVSAGKALYKGDKKTAKETVKVINNLLAPTDIEHKISGATPEHINNVRQLLQKGKYGATMDDVHRADMVEYLEQVQKDIPVIIEGVDVLKLEILPNVIKMTNQLREHVVPMERNELIVSDKLSKLLQYIDSL